MDKHLLDILCCPQSKAPLRPLRGAELEALNRAVGAGTLLTVDGAPVAQPLQAGLITVDGKVVYRVEDDIPVLLVEEAIGTTQLNEFPTS
ncbi:MAG TPA: Trm112 family protein [Rhodanobacteraceae bacterium]|nr:Trm112 family protein [Rhodanobacteraceae bacterium]